MRNNSDLILDRLRRDIPNIAPEVQDLHWGIAKKEVSMMIKNTSASRSLSIYFFFMTLGAGLGIYGIKRFPKTKIVKYVKYVKHVIDAQSRLNKIAIEESYRIDEALETEQQFINMLGQDTPFETKFSLDHNSDGPPVHFSVKFKKDKKEDDASQ